MIVVLDTNIVARPPIGGANQRCVSKRGLPESMNWPSAIPSFRSMKKSSPASRFAIQQSRRQTTDWLSDIQRSAHVFYPLPLAPHTADPDDGMFIKCAVAAHADYLVTGDKGHLLALKEAEGIPIVAASDFLSLV